MVQFRCRLASHSLHIALQRILPALLRRAPRRRSVAGAAADRQGDNIPLPQPDLVLRSQPDRLTAAQDFAEAGGAGPSPEQALGHGAEPVAVERDVNVV